MVIGVDIYHDSAGKKQSICGFVASMNRNCTRWFSRCRVQPVSQELVDGLKICLVSALTKFHEVSLVICCHFHCRNYKRFYLWSSKEL
jgi:aubergine-like protein